MHSILMLKSRGAHITQTIVKTARTIIENFCPEYQQSCTGAQDMESDLPSFLEHYPNPTITSTQVHLERVGDSHFQVFVTWIEIRYRLTQHPGDSPAHPVGCFQLGTSRSSALFTRLCFSMLPNPNGFSQQRYQLYNEGNNCSSRFGWWIITCNNLNIYHIAT